MKCLPFSALEGKINSSAGSEKSRGVGFPSFLLRNIHLRMLGISRYIYLPDIFWFPPLSHIPSYKILKNPLVR